MNEELEQNPGDSEEESGTAPKDSSERTYYYAGFWKRFFAHLIDSLIVSLGVIILSFIKKVL